jgi:hypothetical protein
MYFPLALVINKKIVLKVIFLNDLVLKIDAKGIVIIL